MLKYLLAAFAAFLFCSPVSAEEPLAISSLTNQACCKVCTNSKACGDSCISKSFNCNKGPGCACNAGSSTPTSGGGKSETPKKKRRKSVKCPTVVADKDTGTYQLKAEYACFTKPKFAEQKGYIAAVE